MSNSIEDSVTVPLIELENSESPPKHSYGHLSVNTTLDPFSPMRKYTQDSSCLSSADIQLFEEQNTFVNVTKTSPTSNRKKELSKSESNLVKFKEKENKKQKKKVTTILEYYGLVFKHFHFQFLIIRLLIYLVS